MSNYKFSLLLNVKTLVAMKKIVIFFIKDSKMSVSKYIESNSENAKVLSFERVELS